MSMMAKINTKTVVLYGPQGSGKSTHAKMIARNFGLQLIVDEWMPDKPIPAEPALLITTVGRHDLPKNIRKVSMDTMRKRLVL